MPASPRTSPVAGVLIRLGAAGACGVLASLLWPQAHPLAAPVLALAGLFIADAYLQRADRQ